jgi:hypothetical protein
MAEFNLNPNITPQPGMGEESIAASAEMIVTGVEEKLNIKKSGKLIKDQKVDMKMLSQYVEKLSEATRVDHIKKWDQRKDKEGEEEQQNPKQRGRKRGKGRRAAGFSWMKRRKPPKRDITIRVGEIDRFRGQLSPKTLKDYIDTHVKTTLGVPKEEQEALTKKLNELKAQFKRMKIKDKFLSSAQAEIDVLVRSEMNRAIKARVLKNISEKNFENWVIKNKEAAKAVNFALYNEYTSDEAEGEAKGFIGRKLKKVVRKNWSTKTKKPKDLIELAEALGIDLKSWVESFTQEKITVKRGGIIHINSSLIESEWQKSVLLDEYKMLHIGLLLEDGLINKFSFRMRLGKVEEGLAALNIRRPEMVAAYNQARKIAWAKLITRLKEAHLTRVLSISEREFTKYSRLISDLTGKAKHVGLGISADGFKLVQAKLEEMAYDTATYKLQLLQSMQSMEFDRKREKNIRWLKTTRANLKATEERTELIEHFSSFLSAVFGRGKTPQAN